LSYLAFVVSINQWTTSDMFFIL